MVPNGKWSDFRQITLCTGSHCANWESSIQALIQPYPRCSPCQSAACLPFRTPHLLCLGGFHTVDTWVVLDNSGRTEEAEGWMGLPSPFSLYSALGFHITCHSSKEWVQDKQPQPQQQRPWKPMCHWSLWWLGCPSLPQWLLSYLQILAGACILLWMHLPPWAVVVFFLISFAFPKVLCLCINEWISWWTHEFPVW